MICLVDEGGGEILEIDDEYYLHIQKDIVEDSSFPFTVGEDVWVRFKVGDPKLVVERIEL